MAKFSLRVFKKGKPVYWIIGGVFLFVIFYLLFNKGAPASSGSGQIAVSGGPSEAFQAQAMQINAGLQSAALATNAQLEAARLASATELARIEAEKGSIAAGAQVALAQLGSGEKVSLAQLEQQKYLAQLSTQTNLLMNEQNLTYNAETARLAAETQVELRNIDVGLLHKQMDTQADMFMSQQLTQAHMFDTATGAQLQMYKMQSDNLVKQSLISQVSSLKKKDRDNALIALAQGTPYRYQGGGGTPLLS